MAESKLVQLNFAIMCPVYIIHIYVYSIQYAKLSDIRSCHNLFMHSLPSMIILYLAVLFYIEGVFA